MFSDWWEEQIRLAVEKAKNGDYDGLCTCNCVDRRRFTEQATKYNSLQAENERLKAANKRLRDENCQDYHCMCLAQQEKVELQKQVDELKGGKGLFISQDQIDWVCSLGVMVHIEEDSPVVLLNRHKYENTCADYDRRIFHFEEEKEQAVKDTAKEILQRIMNIIKKSDGFLAEEVIRIMAKQKGVEVE